jgi:hypothetical protein
VPPCEVCSPAPWLASCAERLRRPGLLPLYPGNIGHYGTGDLEIRIATEADLDRAKPLLEQSYEAS